MLSNTVYIVWFTFFCFTWPLQEHNTRVNCICLPLIYRILLHSSGLVENFEGFWYLLRATHRECLVPLSFTAEAEVEEVSEAGILGETCVRHHYPVLWWCSNCKAFQCRSCTHYESCPERLPAGEAIVHLKQAQVESSERTVLALNKLKSNLETERDKLNVSIDRMMEEVRQLETKVKKVQSQVSDWIFFKEHLPRATKFAIN